MNTLVLIGLALVVAGCVLLAVRFAPRARRQFAAPTTQPRTVADLVRLRQEGGSLAQAAPPDAGPRGAAPPAEPAQTRPAPAAAPAAPEPPAPEPVAEEPPAVFVPPSPRPTPVAGRAQRESAEPPSPALDGDNAPWQRGARMAVGLGGGQPWREPPAPPAQLRVVPAAEAPAPEEVAEPVSVAETESHAEPTPSAEAATGSPDAGSEPEEPAVQPQSVWVTPEAVGGRSEPEEARGQTPAEPAAQGQAAWTEPGAVSEAPGATTISEASASVSVEPVAGAVRVAPEAVADSPGLEPVEPAAEAVGVASEAVGDSSGSEPAVPAASSEVPVEPAAWGVLGAVAEPSRSEEPEAAAPEESVEPVAGAVWVAPEAVDGSPGSEPPVPGTSSEASVEPAAEAVGVASEAVGDSPGSEPAASETSSEASVEPAAQGVWGVLGAVAEPSRSAEPEPPAQAGAEASPESVDPAATADQPRSEPDEAERPAAADADPERRRSRQTPDEKAAEQAAADLALLRTFGFADKALRPNGTAVVAMEGAEEQETPGGSGAAQPVRYRVVRRDGTVVGGATVTLLDDRGGDVAAGAADAGGRGEVLAPSPGGYVLVSTAAGHQPGAVAITVGGSPTEADVLIARSASVSGFVHGTDGPIEGARVTLVQDGEAVDAVDTDAQGAYRVGDIGAGEYGLSVAAPGREPVAALLEVAEEAEVRHDVQLGPAADGGLVEDDAMSGLR